MSEQLKQPYPPLAQVRRTLKPRWYRSPIDRDRLRALSKRSDKAGWLQAGGHFAVYCFFALSTVFFWSQQWWFAVAVCLWCTGFVASFFSGTAPHELGHGTVFQSRRLNRAFLYLFSLISWWDPFDYASSHTYHHRYTTHPNADRENLLPIEPSLHPWLVVQLLSVNLFSKPGRNFGKGGLFWTVYLTARTASAKPAGHLSIPIQEWLYELHKDQPVSFTHSVNWSRILLVFHGVVFVQALLTGWWVLPLVLTLAPFIARCGSYATGVTQHCGLQQNVCDFRKNTRSIKLNPVLSFLYWHMNWHIEHHMYANVPCYNLDTLSEELKHDMPEPRTLLGAWIEMRDIWRMEKADADYVFDTPLPAGAGAGAGVQGSANVSDEHLVSSIGELAPKGWQETP